MDSPRAEQEFVKSRQASSVCFLSRGRVRVAYGKVVNLCHNILPIFRRQGRLVILLVEDDPNDIRFVQRATERENMGHTVQAVRDG